MINEYKQTVLLVHNYYQIPGGEDTVVNNEKRLLEENGHKVFLYTRHNAELKEMGLFDKVMLIFSSVYNLRTVWDIKKIIKEKKIDIVHVHNTLPLISPSVYYVAKKCNIPVVQTIHNFRFLCPAATFFRNGHICEDCLKKGLRCSLYHKCYRKSFFQTLLCVCNTLIHRYTGILKRINFVCLTEFNKEKMLLLKEIDPSKVFVKPNFTFGFDSSDVDNDSDEDNGYFLYIGRLEEIKGVRLLIEAFNSMPNENLKLAGTGPLMSNLNFSKNIELLGFVKHEDLVPLIKQCKAIILPSQIYEGFPMVIPEAFSLHKSVIVGDIGNNGVIVKDGVNGKKFTYNSVDSLISVIKNFNEEIQNKLEVNSYLDYEKMYSSKTNYLIIKKIYDNISFKA